MIKPVYTPPEHTIRRPGKVRVMRAMNDGTMDYWLPLDRAKELEKDGKLFFELTNRLYHTTGSSIIL